MKKPVSSADTAGDAPLATRRTLLGALASAPVLLTTGCAVTSGSRSPADKRREIDTGYDRTLDRLYKEVRGSRELATKARGILVFPSILQAGFIVGGEYGEGALRVGGQPSGYYRLTSGSLGFQAGAQSKALVLMFMTQPALERLRTDKSWTVGVDASVALVKVGANGEIDNTTINQQVNAFALTNAGLMASLNIEGSRISPIEP